MSAVVRRKAFPAAMGAPASPSRMKARESGSRTMRAAVPAPRFMALALCAMLAVPALAPAAPLAVGAQDAAIDERALRADMQRMIEQRRRELLPEYERRVRSDGKASADDWLRKRAEELGRRDGATIRRKYDGSRSGARETAPAPSAAAGEDAGARQKRGDRSCAHVVTRQQAVPSLSGGAMEMIMVTECVPAAKAR